MDERLDLFIRRFYGLTVNECLAEESRNPLLARLRDCLRSDSCRSASPLASSRLSGNRCSMRAYMLAL